MNGLFTAMLIIILFSLMMGRLLLVLSMWPTYTARIAPWLRTQSWWPVPAQRRAESLLLELLTPSEYEQVCATGFLEVASPTRTSRVYRVPRGPGQVLVVDDGRVVERHCVQPEYGGLPEADVVLMHKLLIQTDEERYLRVANHFPTRGGSMWCGYLGGTALR